MEPIYVLKENNSIIDTYYHCHGSFEDKQLAVKQTDMKYARRFPTKIAAEDFNAELPEWLSGRFSVVEVSGWKQFTNDVSPLKPEYQFSMGKTPLGLVFCFD